MSKTRLYSFRLAPIALFSVMLVLWMNLAFIQHQYDLAPSHHQEHHCQLFAAAHHAVASAPISIIDLSLPDRFERLVTYQYQAPSIFAYRARSPPSFPNV